MYPGKLMSSRKENLPLISLLYLSWKLKQISYWSKIVFFLNVKKIRNKYYVIFCKTKKNWRDWGFISFIKTRADPDINHCSLWFSLCRSLRSIEDRTLRTALAVKNASISELHRSCIAWKKWAVSALFSPPQKNTVETI